MQDVMSVKSATGEYGNPFFETSSDILVLDTRDIVEKSGVYNVYRMESQGCQQYYNLYANGSCSHEEEQYTLSCIIAEKWPQHFLEIVCCISVSWW